MVLTQLRGQIVKNSVHRECSLAQYLESGVAAAHFGAAQQQKNAAHDDGDAHHTCQQRRPRDRVLHATWEQERTRIQNTVCFNLVGDLKSG